MTLDEWEVIDHWLIWDEFKHAGFKAEKDISAGWAAAVEPNANNRADPKVSRVEKDELTASWQKIGPEKNKTKKKAIKYFGTHFIRTS